MAKDSDQNKFSKRLDVISVVVVTLHLGLVFAPVYLAVLATSVPHLICQWLWLGLTMNGLLNLMHECAHYHVFQARWGSNALGRWVLGPLLFADFDGYRHRHWEHHRKLGLPGDPKDAYRVDIRGWRLLCLLVRCLILIEALKKFRHQTVKAGRADSAPRSHLWVGRTLLVQGFLFSSLLLTTRLSGNHAAFDSLILALRAYCGVYLYGLMTLTVFVATLRAIAEHQHGGDAVLEAGHAVLRNFTGDPLSVLLFGTYGFSEHATHHHEPGIPYYNLKAATARLSAANPGLSFRRGYLATLLMLARPRNGASSKAPCELPQFQPSSASTEKETSGSLDG